MEWIERLNNAVTYIEDNIKGNIDIDEASKIACCSTYHFQRMFAYIAEVPLSEYIRPRRMSLAAVDLKDSSEKVIDVALKYGYDSPTAFTRAFKSVHGISPSQAKNEGVILKAFPPISFKITIKGAIEKYLDDIELVVVGGESDKDARPLDYDWMLSIRQQCINKDTRFEFRQCGTHFIKDGKLYNLKIKDLCSQARKADINC